MLATSTMGWLSEMGSRFVGDNIRRFNSAESQHPTHLGILAFEAAKAMSRIVSLYKSLSDLEISKLRKQIMVSQGVAYLNSGDEGFLLSLACAERLEDLDKSANAVTRFGHKSRNYGLKNFALVYTDLKLGFIDFEKLEYGSRESEKKIEKMERLISSTSALYSSSEFLAELEVSGRKLKQWKRSCAVKMNCEHLDNKIAYQRKEVRQYRETSLWSKTFDKAVGLMARIVCVVYARICVVFGPYIPILPSVSVRNNRFSQPRDAAIRLQPEFCLMEPVKEQPGHRSGPIPSSSNKVSLVRFYSQKSVLFLPEDEGYGADGWAKNNRVFHVAGPNTLGGSGLALRYANVVLLAEKYLDVAASIGDDGRAKLYDMLPENLKASVRSKLRQNMRSTEDDEGLAEGWREALAGIMGWLGPMAHDTVKWQMERNFEKMKFDSKPSVLLLQTLHFSDKEKAEAAIAEVLVGLSFICRYENRRSDQF